MLLWLYIYSLLSKKKIATGNVHGALLFAFLKSRVL
jgi:hypothetical protein